MKKINLSCIVDSQVLCEFWDDGEQNYKILGFLRRCSDYYFMGGNNAGFDNCRIYQNPEYWIANPGGKLVLPDGLLVKAVSWNRVVLEDEVLDGYISGVKMEYAAFIIGYQVTGLADGYEW